MSKYIDIEKEINEMENVLEEHKNDTRIGSDFALGAFRLFIDELKQVPAADVKPITHAHWIKDKGYMLSRCSECKNTIPLGLEYKNKYCFNCGARMDEDIKDV